jgi:hypothetical protein
MRMTNPPFPQNKLTLQRNADKVAYCISLSNILKTLFPQVKASLLNLSGGTEHYLCSGNFMLVKDYRRKSWKDSHWRGPYQVLMTAVKVAERDTWIQVSRC